MQVAQSTALRLQIKLTWFEEIFEEYKKRASPLLIYFTKV